MSRPGYTWLGGVVWQIGRRVGRRKLARPRVKLRVAVVAVSIALAAAIAAARGRRRLVKPTAGVPMVVTIP